MPWQGPRITSAAGFFYAFDRLARGEPAFAGRPDRRAPGQTAIFGSLGVVAQDVRYVIEVVDLGYIRKPVNSIWQASELRAEILVEQDSERVHRGDLRVEIAIVAVGKIERVQDPHLGPELVDRCVAPGAVVVEISRREGSFIGLDNDDWLGPVRGEQRRDDIFDQR